MMAMGITRMAIAPDITKPGMAPLIIEPINVPRVIVAVMAPKLPPIRVDMKRLETIRLRVTIVRLSPTAWLRRVASTVPAVIG